MISDDGAPHILIVNAHSQANAGDGAIVLGQLRLLKKLSPTVRLTITSRTPELDRPLLAKWGVTVVPPIFHAPAGFAGGWRCWRNVILSLVFPRQALTFLRHLQRADLVMVCGGGYLYSTRLAPGLTFWQNYLHIRMAVLFKKKIIFFPQSYGPLINRWSRRLLGRLFASDQVRAVFAREAISLSFASGILPAGTVKSKLQFCPDMAFYHWPEPGPAPMPVGLAGLPRPRLALALRDWNFPQQKSTSAKRRKREIYLQGVITTAETLHRKYDASLFIFSQAQGPSRTEDDRSISSHVYARLRSSIPSTHLNHIEIPTGSSPDAIIQSLRQADMLITSRMHAAIFAFLAGIPAVVIGYQHKSLGMLQSLGLGECSIAIEETQPESLLALCETILQNRNGWTERIRRAVGDTRETIEAKFRVLFAEPILHETQ